jgi:hypothetical protein
MKITALYLLLFFCIVSSCKKDTVVNYEITSEIPWANPDSSGTDYRDAVVGDYAGIFIFKRWLDDSLTWAYDTSSTILTISKSDNDSLIELTGNPQIIQESTFKYENNYFISQATYHAPELWLKNDSLFFYWKPVLGPFFYLAFTKKVP